MIHIDFLKFSLEPGENNNRNCLYDFLAIRDGDESGKEVGTYCGTPLPNPVTTSKNAVFLKFVSDSSTIYPGFKLRWRAVKDTIGVTIGPTVRSKTTQEYYSEDGKFV